jgi:hypothetical protein
MHRKAPETRHNERKKPREQKEMKETQRDKIAQRLRDEGDPDEK